ncbi:MAG: HAMP domain-containing protein [Ignavibacteriales bacterium]|nr:HAMP domain-containing protein [Ignavibacteriales bacterium]
MKFRNKILLAIWGVVFGLLIILYTFISSWVHEQVETRFSEDLRGMYSVLHQMNDLQAEQDLKAAQILAESPRLKTVVAASEKKAAVLASQELTSNMGLNLFLITDEQGNLIVQLLNGVEEYYSINQLFVSHRFLQQPRTMIWSLGTDIYRCASVPLVEGKSYLGTLTIGYRLTHSNLFGVQSMSKSEVVLMIDSTIVGSTLPWEFQTELSAWATENAVQHVDIPSDAGPEIFPVSTSRDEYIGVFCRLDRRKNFVRPMYAYLLLKSVEKEVDASLRPVMDTFIVLSVVVLIITAGIGYVISKGITKPIAVLVRGTSEVARGNYDYKMNIKQGDELGFLSERFGEMSKSLKEKIHLLDFQKTELEHALTQLKEAQDELVKSERLAATGRITAQLSHEINNPIHNILSCLQTALKRTEKESPERELIEVAFEEVERLAKLTRQMLDIYRTSMVQESREPTCVNKVIQEVLASSNPVLQQSKVSVETSFTENLPKIAGLQDKLKQVFLNLFINAKDAMPDGGTLSVQTLRHDSFVIIYVTDTGTGISQEHINKIFDAFFTTKGKVSGVGLGLSVTYGIIQQHQGTITVKSQLGKGTTFTISFPILNTEQTHG